MNAKDKITKTLGGDRLGSGSKMKVDLKTYNRSTHDLSRAWRSTMTSGVLYPCLKLVALPGDSIEIDLMAATKTIPTKAPLYGSYKKQIDVFQCPIRLYNGLLHNNMTKIGLNMAQVKLPKILLTQKVYNPTVYNIDINQSQIASDSLLNYLGLRGVGDFLFTVANTSSGEIERKFNAVPILAYWDIYKNYYANKQEEKGAYICANPYPFDTLLDSIRFEAEGFNLSQTFNFEEPSAAPIQITGDTYQRVNGTFYYSTQTSRPAIIRVSGKVEFSTIQVVTQNPDTTYNVRDLLIMYPNAELLSNGDIYTGQPIAGATGERLSGFGFQTAVNYASDVNIKTFDLQNIDDARIAILQNTGLNQELLINTLAEPYSDLVQRDSRGDTYNKYHLHGLALKTYQADYFNNWMQTEWIDGATGINTITAVDVSSGSFTIDALNLANKVYNMLNRIAISGGTYEDYIETVYSTETARRAESPIYLGGMSQEIVFDEVVSQSATNDEPLGTLAGKGQVKGTKGGKIDVKITEPSYIIAIVSYTPRVDYSQGNDFDVTELDTLYDLHKPELDGIGFQDLLCERMAWFGTYWDAIQRKFIKEAAGKIPAWQDYMTAVNETHGGFAEENGQMFMTLNRRYEYQPHITGFDGGIGDLTTYVDPRKYNYSFADTSLSAQNFWEQIGMKIIVRRVMSAKVMPNL